MTSRVLARGHGAAGAIAYLAHDAPHSREPAAPQPTPASRASLFRGMPDFDPDRDREAQLRLAGRIVFLGQEPEPGRSPSTRVVAVLNLDPRQTRTPVPGRSVLDTGSGTRSRQRSGIVPTWTGLPCGPTTRSPIVRRPAIRKATVPAQGCPSQRRSRSRRYPVVSSAAMEAPAKPPPASCVFVVRADVAVSARTTQLADRLGRFRGCRGGTPRRRVGRVRRGRERPASVSEAERSLSPFRSGELRESQDCDGNVV